LLVLSAVIQKRVETARQIQGDRFLVGAKHSPEGAEKVVMLGAVNASPINCNADMRPAEVRKFCELDETSRTLMRPP
jgi:hypothetical protein